MADVKECQCYAVRLLTRMTNLLDQWLVDMERPEPGLGKLMTEMKQHIQSQVDKPENEHLKDIVGKQLKAIDKAVDEATVGKTRNMRAVDTIRNAIHKSPAIRGVFLCEAPDIPETLLSKKIFNVLEVLEIGEAPTAKKQLDDIFKELTCGA